MSESERRPSGRAAALKYDPEKNGAPVVVASGMGYTAEKITETAMRAGVPVYEDDSLATMLTQLKLGAEIPKELYQAIVEIYVYFLKYSLRSGGEQDHASGAQGTAGETADSSSGEEAASSRMSGTGSGAASGFPSGMEEETDYSADHRADLQGERSQTNAPAKDAPRTGRTETEWEAGSPFIQL